MTIRHLRNGRVWIGDTTRDPLVVGGPDHESRAVRISDEGVLRVGTSVAPDDIRRGRGPTNIFLWADPTGVGGTSDPAIRRLHGWRGTRGDICVTAYGWRRVESIQVRRSGERRIVLSRDLRRGEP